MTENTIAHIIDVINGEIKNNNSKIVIFDDESFVFLPKDNFKDVQTKLNQYGFVINGNETINTITDECYKIKFLPKAISDKFKLTPDTNRNIKLEFKLVTENKSYYYLGQHNQDTVEKIMLLFIRYNLEGFYDEEICKLFERKFRKK